MTREENRILTHEEAFALLPWHVNESLAEAEAARLGRHVAACAACQQEIVALENLARAVVASNGRLPSPSPHMLARVLDRIEDYEAARAHKARTASIAGWRARLSGLWSAWPTRGRVALAGQFAGLLLLVIALLFATQRARRFSDLAAREKARADQNEQLLKVTEQRYETLAGPNPENAGPSMRLTVSFQERATEKEIRELLNEINATIVRGPSPQRLYVVALPVTRNQDRQQVAATALNRLRAKPKIVLFAAEQPE